MPTHWKKLNNPNYLGAYAFEPGEEKTGTIDRVVQEKVTGSDGKAEECIVCYFKEKALKPLILNVTNCKTITKLYNTPYIENWARKKITMHVKPVKAFGDMVDAVRIKNKVSGDKVAEIKCEECGQVIKGMGQYGPEFVANKNKERYGLCLCIECGKKVQAEIDKATNTVKAEGITAAVNEQDDLAAQLLAEAGE